MNFASLFPAFLALASISEGVYAQSVVEPLVQYTFNDNTDRLKNTGTGDDVLNLTLDGVLFPAEENGIVFDQDTALFTGQGCIEVPKSRYINGKVSQMRTILLDFFWDGFKNPNHEPQILFEEGGKTNGINIVLRTKEQSDEAELVMGVWEGDNADVILERLFITLTKLPLKVMKLTGLESVHTPPAIASAE